MNSPILNCPAAIGAGVVKWLPLHATGIGQLPEAPWDKGVFIPLPWERALCLLRFVSAILRVQIWGPLAAHMAVDLAVEVTVSPTPAFPLPHPPSPCPESAHRQQQWDLPPAGPTSGPSGAGDKPYCWQKCLTTLLQHQWVLMTSAALLRIGPWVTCLRLLSEITAKAKSMTPVFITSERLMCPSVPSL